MPALTEEQYQLVRRSAKYKHYKGRCPVCNDTKKYRLLDQQFECEQDAYGCVSNRLFRLYLAHNIPQDFYALDFDDYPFPDVKKALEDYIANFDSMMFHGMGIEIFGSKLGSGKTWSAVHVQKELTKLGVDTWFTDFKEIKSLFQMTNHQERDWRTERILNAALLVIDEIIPPISDPQQAFFAEKLEWVIRHRSNSGLPTITTSNMTPEELREHYPRVYSLLSAKQYRHELSSDEDYRIANAFNDRDVLAQNGETRPYT